MKKTLLALLLTAAGAVSPNLVKAEDKKPKFDLWMEAFSQVDLNNTNLYQSRLELSKDGDSYFFRADYTNTDSNEAVRLGSRLPLDFNALRGEAGIFGASNSNGSNGIGLEFDGDLLDFLKISGSLEQNNNNQLEHLMIGKEFPLDITTKLGYFRLNGKSHLNGAAWKTLNDQYFLGIGGRVDEEGQGRINACFGHYFKKKGEGIGWRLFGQTDFNGNFTINGILALGNYNSLGSFSGLMDAYKGGINDPGIVSNIVDARASPVYTKGKAVISFKIVKKKDSPANYFAELHHNFGNLGLLKNIRAGEVWYHEDIPNPKDIFTTVLSANIGPLVAEYTCALQNGSRPVHTFYVGTSLNDCLDALRE